MKGHERYENCPVLVRHTSVVNCYGLDHSIFGMRRGFKM